MSPDTLIIFNKGDTKDLPRLEKVFSDFLGRLNSVYFSNNFKSEGLLMSFISFIILFPIISLKSFGKKNIIVISDGLLGFVSVIVGFLNSKKTLVVLKDDSLVFRYNLRSKFLIPIRDFYRILPRLKRDESLCVRMNRLTTSYSDFLLFYDKNIADVWENFYGFSREKALVLETKKVKKNKK